MAPRHARHAEKTGPADRPAGSAKSAALGLLGRRDYTAAELTRRLTTRGYSPEDVADVVAGLAASGVLDDRRTALAHARTASSVKGRGPLRIRRELQARGVEADVVHEATAGITDVEVAKALDRFLTRKGVQRPVPRDERTRLFQQLLRRGFPSRLISKALGGVDVDLDDEE